jgi:hypothetical protein
MINSPVVLTIVNKYLVCLTAPRYGKDIFLRIAHTMLKLYKSARSVAKQQNKTTGFEFPLSHYVPSGFQGDRRTTQIRECRNALGIELDGAADIIEDVNYQVQEIIRESKGRKLDTLLLMNRIELIRIDEWHALISVMVGVAQLGVFEHGTEAFIPIFEAMLEHLKPIDGGVLGPTVEYLMAVTHLYNRLAKLN